VRPRTAGCRYSGVIAGLDPAIHHLRLRMDARVKPAHDDRCGAAECRGSTAA
jgi:hypothetical protein